MRTLLRSAAVAALLSASPLLAQTPATGTGATGAPAADTTALETWGAAPVGRYALAAQVGERSEKATITIAEQDGKLVGTMQPDHPGAPPMPLVLVASQGQELVLQLRTRDGGTLHLSLRRKKDAILGIWEDSRGNSGPVEGTVLR